MHLQFCVTFLYVCSVYARAGDTSIILVYHAASSQFLQHSKEHAQTFHPIQPSL